MSCHARAHAAVAKDDVVCPAVQRDTADVAMQVLEGSSTACEYSYSACIVGGLDQGVSLHAG